MNKVKYYLKKIKENLNKIFSIKRIKRYGFNMAVIDFLIFLMHRNNSNLEHWLIRRKDLIVQKYLYKNYPQIIMKIRRVDNE